MGNFGFVLFDNTPGGAGFVRQLVEPEIFMNMLKEGFRVVTQCDCGGASEDTACYSCLCNYYNQKQHDVLKRRYAIEFYRQFASSPDAEWLVTRNEEVYVAANNVDDEKTDSEISDVCDTVKFKEHFQLLFCNKGQNQMSESETEIWENLLEDCDEDECKIIQQIADKKKGSIAKPICREYIEIIETGEKFFVDEVWKDKKVMLFLADSYDDYEVAKKTGWYCYCTKVEFDIDEFIKRIEV